MTEYLDCEDAARTGFCRSTGGIVFRFENQLGRGLVFEVGDGGFDVVYLRLKDKKLALEFLHRDGKLPNRIDVGDAIVGVEIGEGMRVDPSHAPI